MFFDVSSPFFLALLTEGISFPLPTLLSLLLKCMSASGVSIQSRCPVVYPHNNLESPQLL